VIPLDICLPDINGYEVAESIRRVSPYSRIIFVTAEASHAVAIAALVAGAMGFVTKQNASNDLIYAIREVMQGRKFLSQNLT